MYAARLKSCRIQNRVFRNLLRARGCGGFAGYQVEALVAGRPFERSELRLRDESMASMLLCFGSRQTGIQLDAHQAMGMRAGERAA